MISSFDHEIFCQISFLLVLSPDLSNEVLINYFDPAEWPHASKLFHMYKRVDSWLKQNWFYLLCSLHRWHRSHINIIFDLAVKKRSKSTQGDNLNKLWWAWVPDPTYQFHRNQSTGSGEETIWWVFTMYGYGAILVMWPRYCEQTFFLPVQGGSTEKWLWLAKRFFENANGWRMDCWRTLEHGYILSWTMSLLLRWA